MNRPLFAISLAICLAFLTSTAKADVKVVASIKPVHSLVAAVMGDVGKPGLIVDGTGSPHTYSMKPSDAEALQSADVIFWVGHELEAFLQKPLDALARNATAVSLMEAAGVNRLALRKGDGFDADNRADEHDHAYDAHIWLDPENAKVLASFIASTLSRLDPANAEKYASNAKTLNLRLTALSSEINNKLTSRDKGFIVFHDAYQYFESRFGLQAAGAIAINPQNPPGAKAIRDLKDRLNQQQIVCIFSEPQFDNKLVNLVIEGTSVKTAVLDPLGIEVAAGPDHYIMMMQSLAHAFESCLS
jgi:zinc transport system substrate-binding protein